MNIMYDLLMRLPLLGWVVLSAITQLQGLGQFMTAPIDSVYVIHIACDSRQSDLCCSSPPPLSYGPALPARPASWNHGSPP